MLDSDIKSYHAQEVSMVGTNGGRRGDTQIISGVYNNVIPNISRADRLAGISLYRKIFTQAASTSLETLLSVLEWIDKPTLGEDHVVMFVGTPTDTQADLTGSERKYGAAYLKTDIVGGASTHTFTVTVEHVSQAGATDIIFKNGDSIRLTDMDHPTATTGSEEFLTISAEPIVSGSDVTITVTESILNSYSVASGARAISIIPFGDVKTFVTDFAVTSAGDGDYDIATYPILLDNDGTITDDLTLNFTDATHYTVVGVSGVNYGAGDTATDFTPMNTARGKKYFTIYAAGFSGSFAQNDTIVWKNHAADVQHWIRLTVPENCQSLANSMVRTVTDAESNS